MSNQPKSIPAGEFRTHCFALLDKVARTRQPLIVTKQGKPIAKIVPTETPKRRKLLGSVKFHGNVVDPILPKMELMPLTPPIAVKATQLGRDFPGDPADRLIVATTILESAMLITKDSRIRDYKAVNTIW